MNKVSSAAKSNGAPAKTSSNWILRIGGAGAVAACLMACAPVALAQTPATQSRGYKPLQSISYTFGSKFTSGYFEAHAGACLVTLMVIEKSPPDEPLPFTAARLRLTLTPGQIAGLDSEEGRSLNFTCGEGAATLLVDVGERERLVELQKLTFRKTAAE